MFEKTCVLIKPDAVQRGLVGKIIERFEQKGFKILGIKMVSVDDVLLAEHYSHIADKPFFAGVKDFMKSSPIIAMVIEGLDAVKAVRLIAGVTKAREADAGTIRGDFAMGMQANVIHASDSSENAEKEIKRFFKEEEIFNYGRCDFQVVYSGELK
jgi:nucleoside-diphosphate kinase